MSNQCRVSQGHHNFVAMTIQNSEREKYRTRSKACGVVQAAWLFAKHLGVCEVAVSGDLHDSVCHRGWVGAFVVDALFPVARVLDFPVARVLGSPVAPVLGFPVARVLGFPVVRVVAFPVVRIVAFPVVRVVAFPVAQVVTFPVVQVLPFPFLRNEQPLLRCVRVGSPLAFSRYRL